LGLGCHGDVGLLRHARRCRIDRHHSPRAWSWESISSIPPTSTGRSPTRWLVGRAIKGPAPMRSSSPRSSGTCVRRDGKFIGQNGPARICEGGLRRLAQPARRRPHRPVLPAPRRFARGADRGHCRRHGRPRARRQGALPRTLGGPPPRPSGARTSFIRSAAPPNRVIHCGAATSSRRSCRRSASSASGFVAYSPLGRGFLTGQIKRPEDIEEGDWRKKPSTLFRGENFQKNLDLVARVTELAP